MKVASGFLLVILLSLSTAGLALEQDDRRSDKDQINALIERLSDHSVTAEKVLDPALVGTKRKTAIGKFNDSTYQLSITRTEEARVTTDGHAVLPARIHFKNQTNELDADAGIKFIERDGTWYFADFDFLDWPTILIIVFIAGTGVSIFYSTMVLVFYYRLKKTNQLTPSNFFKLFIPIFWPRLFAGTRR